MFNLKVGDGRALVDWIFIDNLTHALLLAAAVPFESSAVAGSSSRCLTVHVSDEDPREMNHLFCSFAAGLGYHPPSIYIPTALLARIAALMVFASRLCGGLFTPMLTPCEALKAGTHMVFCTADARRTIKWQPVVAYEDGIKLTLEYEHRKLLRCPPTSMEVPHLLWWFIIVGGMWLCWVGDAAAAAARVGSGECGLPSTLLCSVVVFGSKAAAALGVTLRFIFFCALLAHAVEAVAALRVVREMKRASRESQSNAGSREPGQRLFDWSAGVTCAYVAQTFALGFPSLKIILRYRRLQQRMLSSGVIAREARGEALL